MNSDLFSLHLEFTQNLGLTLIYMKSIFEQMGGTYRQEGDYLIPNLSLPDESEYQIGK